MQTYGALQWNTFTRCKQYSHCSLNGRCPMNYHHFMWNDKVNLFNPLLATWITLHCSTGKVSSHLINCLVTSICHVGHRANIEKKCVKHVAPGHKTGKTSGLPQNTSRFFEITIYHSAQSGEGTIGWAGTSCPRLESNSCLWIHSKVCEGLHNADDG